MENNSNYTIKLSQFEGPFDLLLFFIERDELDIYDIPIAKITEDFLAYVREMESLNLDLASEFILVAATLIRIKAKMLLPRKELDENNEEIDPRKELVQKLLEYKAVKEAITELSSMEDDQYFRIPRGNIHNEFQALSQIYNYEYTIGEQQEKIRYTLKISGKADFEKLFEECENRIHAIITFLALLEMVNLQQLKITKGENLNQFWVEEKPEEEQDLDPQNNNLEEE